MRVLTLGGEMRFLLVLAVAFSCLVSTAGVHAQSSQSREARITEAKKAFAVGTRAYAHGEFKTALTSFQRAYKLTRSPDLLYNIATVSDRMRRDEDALEAYEGYLEARPESADREHVESRIDVLRAAIEARRRAEIDAEIEARSAAIEAAARVKAERPLTQHVGPGPGPCFISIAARYHERILTHQFMHDLPACATGWMSGGSRSIDQHGLKRSRLSTIA